MAELSTPSLRQSGVCECSTSRKPGSVERSVGICRTGCSDSEAAALAHPTLTHEQKALVERAGRQHAFDAGSTLFKYWLKTAV